MQASLTRSVLLNLSASLVLGSAAAQGEFSSAKINWQQRSGETINLLMSRHPWQEAIEPLLPEFTKLTGVKVRTVSLPEQQFTTKLPADLTAGSFEFDVFMSQYYDKPKYAAEKWTADLKPFMDNTKLTDPKWYNWGDFFPGARAIATIGNTYMDRLPITAEAQILVYRKDLLAKAGVSVPQTFDQLLAAAQTIKAKTGVAGITVRGGADLWWPMYGLVKSYGGDYVTGNTSQATNPATVAGVNMYAELARQSPLGVTTAAWDQINTAMLTGQAAMFLDSSVIFPRLQDTTISQVAGKIGAAPMPSGPQGRAAHSHFWSISMSNTSKSKEAAWLFMEWATSASVQGRLALKGVLAPRNSGWNVPGFDKLYPADYRAAVQTSLKSSVISPVNVKFFELMDPLRSNTQEVMLSKQSAADGMKSVQAAWQRILGK